MILIGDKLVPYEEFYPVTSIEEIQKTKANSTISFRFNEELLRYSYENNLNFAVIVDSIKDSIYANALNSKYIISNKNLAKSIQKIAENYMFDSKILAIIDSNNELEEIASYEIDGIIYKYLVK